MTTTVKTAQAFYDSEASSGLSDYAHGNPRLERAIKHALQWLPKHFRRVLDIGCGIGWSSWEIKRHHPDAFVLGVDLSPKRIEMANTLFSTPGLEFRSLNVLESNLSGTFDALVMLDVYEHIPRALRPEFHRFARNILESGGAWILTCPTVEHQHYLRDHNPGGLQPVDEDVTEPDLRIAADDIGGKLAFHKNVTIWNENDYFHAVIQKTPDSASTGTISLEASNERAQRVHSRLGVRITRAGIALPDREGPNVCVIYPNRGTYSETFIRNHAERLPGRIRLLYDGWFPTRREDDSRLLPRPIAVINKAERFLPGTVRGINYSLRNRALARYLRSNKIDVVLAEYGPTGAAVMDACKSAGVPLVVHFHGFDAHHGPTLAEYRAAYERLFTQAAAFVAVSKEMEDSLISLGAPRPKVHYSPCGVDPSLFDGADPSVSDPLFVSVGRFVEKKAPHLSILAFSKVVSKVPEARLVMVGDGELLEACKQLARSLRIVHRVEFKGPCTHSQVADLMRTARAFIQHSVRTSEGDSEGTPVAVLEAGAAGLPVVGTRHAGIKDVVVEGKTGFLVDEYDVDEMAGYMTHLATDSALAATIGKQARDHIRANFSLDRTIDRLWPVIQNAIRSGTR